MNIEKLLKELSLEEKASLCSGADFWTTKKIDRLNIPSIMLADGPHGLRKQTTDTDPLGINRSIPATCFPSAACSGASWNRELIYLMGEAIAKECLAEEVSVLLGPGVNIKRSPLCGRNFEYFSEDPYLSSQMGLAQVKGVQSQGVGTSLKHFAMNNQEHRRFSVTAEVDERTAREIYLRSFEDIVKEGQPWTIMCAYNRINGTYAAENYWLLDKVLRKEWGYKGIIVTDWGACADRVKGLEVGLDLQMPADNGENDQKIVEAVREGRLSMDVLDMSVKRLLELIYKGSSKTERPLIDRERHHDLARKVAEESMVLLKNDGDLLPLSEGIKIAVLGELAEIPRYQGSGSSRINPTKLVSPLDALKGTFRVSYQKGYLISDEERDEELEQEAMAYADEIERAIVFIGLPDRYESEGFDRDHLNIPENQLSLIENASHSYKHVIVVLANGAPIIMPWLNKVDAVLEGFLGGQGIGGAIRNIISGRVNPSGKLTESYPLRLEDTPSYLNFPGYQDIVDYSEGIFIGYRYYEKVKRPILFPFGYGLSYTTFEYTDILLDKKSMNEDESLTVTCRITNTGPLYGQEVVQVYVGECCPCVPRPLKELKAFEKVALEPGESKDLTFTLSKEAFAYYDVRTSDWQVNSGEFQIYIGASVSDIRLRQKLELKSHKIPRLYSRDTCLLDFMDHPVGKAFVDTVIEQMRGNVDKNEIFDEAGLLKMIGYANLRFLKVMSGQLMSEEAIDNLLKQLNS